MLVTCALSVYARKPAAGLLSSVAQNLELQQASEGMRRTSDDGGRGAGEGRLLASTSVGCCVTEG